VASQLSGKLEAKLACITLRAALLPRSPGSLKISRETARNQLKSVFVKTYMHRHGIAVREVCVRAKELQAPGGMGGDELFQKQPAEQPREHAHRHKEARPAGYPPLAVQGNAPSQGTIMWTCGWWVSADPQVCSTVGHKGNGGRELSDLSRSRDDSDPVATSL